MFAELQAKGLDALARRLEAQRVEGGTFTEEQKLFTLESYLDRNSDGWKRRGLEPLLHSAIPIPVVQANTILPQALSVSYFAGGRDGHPGRDAGNDFLIATGSVSCCYTDVIRVEEKLKEGRDETELWRSGGVQKNASTYGFAG